MTTKLPNRFNATRVATLPPGEYTDPATRGLQLRVREGARGITRTWLFRYKWRGRALRIVIGHFPGKSLVQAREDALAMHRSIDDGIDPRRGKPRRRITSSPLPLSSAIANPEDKHSIEFLASEFMERHIKPSRKRPEYAQAILDRDILPEWKGRDARTIKPREIIELLDKIVARGSPVQANRTAALLGQMFKFGIHRAIVETSPVQLLYRPGGKEKPKERALTDQEIKALLSDPNDLPRFQKLNHVIRILLFTGQRRGELALAKRGDIDLEKKTWRIPPENSKTGKGHLVPITDLARTEFEALIKLAGKSKFLLPDEDGKEPANPKLLTRNMARALERFEKLFQRHNIRHFEPFTLHDLRRTCRTGLARLKIEPHIAERVLNHAQEKIPGTYDVYDYFDEKREALEKWAAHLKGLPS